MLGGGIFVTQNKTLPGSYINFINASAAGSSVTDRGVVAISLPLLKEPNSVFEITKNQFITEGKNILGVSYDDNKSDLSKILREIFCHATKVIIYDHGDGPVDVIAITKALEAYEFNILCAYTDDSAEITKYIAEVKKWRDELGKKCQVVVYNATEPDYEGVINVVSTVSNDGADAHALVAWVAGAEAACKVSESCTNKLYDGEYTIDVNKTQSELEDCIDAGEIAFHRVYGDIRLLEDVNSLTTTTSDKGEDFKSNQTIRVIDQIANDIAKLFNTKYLGRIPNNESGRVSLWADIVAHHRHLESIGAIENFDANLLTVTKGENKKSVVVNDAITVTNSMAQLYMTVVIK